MSPKLRLSARIGMSVLALALGAGAFWIKPIRAADHDPVAGTAKDQPSAAVIDYADQISRLVQNRRIDDLAKLALPADAAGDAESAKLKLWSTEYVSAIEKQQSQRDKQYADAVDKAQDYLKRGKFVEAMERVVNAYQIAKDQQEFIKLDWVKGLTDKVAAQAADYEKQGRWLESLQLYYDLNSLYEIDTRYKSDMQRLSRRTRLLSVYTPKILFDMRKAIVEKLEREKAETQPATAPSTAPGAATQASTTQASATAPGIALPAELEDDPANFTRWQDVVEGSSVDMMKDALSRARNDWVEETTYATLLRGGVEALRLFLTTPELAKEFTGLADAGKRAAFQKALDEVVARADAVKDRDDDIGPADVDELLQKIIDANDASIKLPQEVLVFEFTDGAMEKLDPFTAVIWPHEFDEFEKNTRGSFGGVGIQISLENGQLKVISPLEDTPAFHEGIEAGDIITGIDGKSTVGITIDQAVHQIMGKPGTQVMLKIKREGQPDKEYAITRAIIKVTSVKGVRLDMADPDHPKWDFMLDPETKIGYIRITGFQDDTAKELRNAITTLQDKGLRGLILDLRFNPGGLLNEAVEISDMFVDHGTIVSTKGRSINSHPEIHYAHQETAVPTTMPIVVLVNQYSASASEIFSGAMKDLHRALIVGHRSFGKGSVQQLLRIGKLTDPMAMMKLTMAYYYLPDGESLHRRDGNKKWGVDPDVVVDLTPSQILELNKERRDAEIIYKNGATQPAPATTQKSDTVSDTQLDTALLLLRLQLVQSGV